MFGFVGVGQGGSQIADEMRKLEFPAIAINYSQCDLNSLEYIEKRLCFLGSDGVGKQRSIAIELMKDNWESAVSFIKQNLSQPSVEVIFIIFSTAGGSGSGISPLLLEIMTNEMPDKVFVACPILPDIRETLVNQANALSTFDELSKLDNCILPIDNQKAFKFSKMMPKNKIYSTINTSFANSLSEIHKYTEMYSKNGNLDKNDLRQILNTKGIASIGTAVFADPIDSLLEISQDNFSNTIYKSWENNIFVNIEFDQIMRAGVIFDGQESLMQYLDYDLIFSKFNNPVLDMFEGNYHTKYGTVTTVLSGLSWCSTRLAQIEHLVKQNEQVLQELSFNDADNNTRFQSKLNMSDLNSKLRKRPKKAMSVLDIMSKYNR